MKTNKGITLVALIITIIVMVILAGVAISLVTGENGVVSQAENAGQRQNYAIVEERIRTQSEFITEGENAGKVDLAKTEENIRALSLEEIKDISSTKTLLRVTLNDGRVIEINGDNGNNNENLLPEGLVVGSEFEMDADGDGTNEAWIVLYDGTASHLNENEIEVISKNTMGELSLGKSDTEAIANATDIDGNGTVDDIEIAIYSYNNLTDRLNSYCKSLIGINNLGVRTVGSLPSNPSYKSTKKYEIGAKYLDTWTDDGKAAWNMYGSILDISEDITKTDKDQLTILGIGVAGDTKGYIVPCGYASENKKVLGMANWEVLGVRYGLSYMTYGVNTTIFVGPVSYKDMITINNDGTTVTNDIDIRVRPVIKLEYNNK